MANEMIGRSEGTGAVVQTEETREIAEVQAKMVLARQFPRNIDYCRAMIAAECQNKELAEKAVYEFPRGDSVVRGASIRLVECVSRYWGNIVSGIKEVSHDAEGATVRAYCWDLQTNFADEKVFRVDYIRSTRKGNYKVTDPRDQYEMMANMAARRKRACIQAVIPQFIIDEAVNVCQDTMRQSVESDGSIEEVKAKMLTAFKAIAEWITEEDFSVVCGRDFEHLGAKDIVKLRNLYNAIKDGFVKPEVAFKREQEQTGDAVPDEAEKTALNDLNSALGIEK